MVGFYWTAHMKSMDLAMESMDQNPGILDEHPPMTCFETVVRSRQRKFDLICLDEVMINPLSLTSALGFCNRAI